MTFPILASLLVRLVVLLPFQLLRLSPATPSGWTPLALSVFLHCAVALLFTLLFSFLPVLSLILTRMLNSELCSTRMLLMPLLSQLFAQLDIFTNPHFSELFILV